LLRRKGSKQAKKGRNKASLKERKVGAKEERNKGRRKAQGRKEVGRIGVGAGSV